MPVLDAKFGSRKQRLLVEALYVS